MPSLKHTSIRTKVLWAFAALVLFTAGVGLFALRVNFGISVDIRQIEQAANMKAEEVSTMEESLLALKLSEQELAASKYRHLAGLPDAPGIPTPDQIASDFSAAIGRFELQGVAACRKSIRDGLQLAGAEGHPKEVGEREEELALLNQIDDRFANLKTHLNRVQGADTGWMQPLAVTDRWKSYNEVSSLVGGYEATVKKQVAHEILDINGALRITNIVLLSFVAVVLIASILITWFISRMIARPIGILKHAAQQIGAGDLETKVQLRSDDEFGLLATTFNQMTQDIRATTVSKNYVDNILRSMVNAVVVLDRKDAIRSVNAAAERLLSYSEQELIGQPMDRILADSFRELSVLEETRENGALTGAEIHYRAKDEQLIPVTFSASVLKSEAGETTGLVCVAQDISERKKAEREMEHVTKQLLEASRQAGMAEVATNVLHNVGNVLNSVNIASALISESVQNSKIGNLTRAVALMEEHKADLGSFLSSDPRGRQLPGYLSKLAANLEHEQNSIREEVETLVGSVGHIKEIVSMQQNYARVSGVAEKVSAPELIEGALRINGGSLERHGIKVVREDAETPPLLVEKHKVLQILVNLLRNAKHACENLEGKERKVMIRTSAEGRGIRISLSDNGVGIPSENLTRIFSHGFTTKPEGHGFGLHSGALAAHEMGATLSVSSEGEGHGATFTLDLPLQPPKNL